MANAMILFQAQKSEQHRKTALKSKNKTAAGIKSKLLKYFTAVIT